MLSLTLNCLYKYDGILKKVNEFSLWKEKCLTKGFDMQYYCETFIMKEMKTPTELTWLSNAI